MWAADELRMSINLRILMTDMFYGGVWDERHLKAIWYLQDEANEYEHNARELISVSFPGDNDYGAH